MRYSRKALLKKLGAVPTNYQWSWCAMDSNGKFAVFTIWKDLVKKSHYPLSSNDPNITKRNGYPDQQRVIDRVLEYDLPAFGMLCEAEDKEARTRSIYSIDATHLIRLHIKKEKGKTFAKLGHKVHYTDVANLDFDLAIDDLAGAAPTGNESPDRALHSGYSYKRDPKVRAHVIKRSNGRCEYCGSPGFLMANGDRYIEAHHVIALSQQGPDTPQNVIALCPDHHREAHFGVDAEALEQAFLIKLAEVEA
jgi:5-methylcytosine-specific restriction protein A